MIRLEIQSIIRYYLYYQAISFIYKITSEIIEEIINYIKIIEERNLRRNYNIRVQLLVTCKSNRYEICARPLCPLNLETEIIVSR